MRRRTRRVPRGITLRDAVIPLRRASSVQSVSLAAGQASGTADINLGYVQTSDLTSLFREYRIRKVVVEFTPQLDPGNSGVVNNAQLHIVVAKDNEAASVVSYTNVASYNNAKEGTLVAGRTFRYSFVPTPATLLNGGSTALHTWAKNPWIICSTNGITAPHYRLLYYIVSTNASTTTTVDIKYTLYFDVRGIN